MVAGSILTLPSSAKPISEALAVYCKRSEDEKIADLIGEQPLRAILDAPKNSEPVPREPLRLAILVLALCVMGMAIVTKPNEPIFVAIACAWTVTTAIAAGPWIRYLRNRLLNRHEPTRPELAALAVNVVHKRNLQGLDELRKQIGDGHRKVYTVSPGGVVKLLTGNDLHCFGSDHGRILMVSADHRDWFSVKGRPLPQGDIWVDLGGTTARTQLTARDLIREPDQELFRLRMSWIYEQARQRNITGGALISGLAVIEAMRHPDVKGLPFAQALPVIKQVLRGPAASDSIINKMRSSNYPEFEAALHALPLEDLP